MLNYPLDYHSRQAISPSTTLGTLDSLTKKTRETRVDLGGLPRVSFDFISKRIEWRWGYRNPVREKVNRHIYKRRLSFVL